MARRTYRYSLNRRDAKLVGVCSALGEKFGIDPTFIRIAAIASAIWISFAWTLAAYAIAGIYFSVQRKREIETGRPRSDFDRMADVGTVKPTVHALRTELDETDRRLMAIDHHLSTPNEELAREIEALREEK